MVNGVDLWCDTIGDANDEPLLLITGSGNSGKMWDPAFCQLFTDSGYYVVRYDARDTGETQTFDFDATPYTLTDMANDADALLGALGIEQAHVIGASMGGMVAQELAIGHPERIRTLTLIMSTPAVSDPVDAMPTGQLTPVPPSPQ